MYWATRSFQHSVWNGYKFTGKERDSESGLDNFGARYDASTLGRFMTPDWAEKPTAVPYANFGNPQSLNLYAFAKNNPTTFGDPDGHVDCSGTNAKGIGCQLIAQWKSAFGLDQIKTKPPLPNPTTVLGKRHKPNVDNNGNPTTPPPPGAPKWQYQQSTGITDLKVGDLTIQPVKGGYSGHGQGLNDPESESVGESDDKANAGPLPKGKYTIGPWYNGSKGNPMARLAPGPDTEMFGRYAIEWHADNRSMHFSASTGYIASPQDARQAIAGSHVTDLEVVP